jgi:hypothetical protein
MEHGTNTLSQNDQHIFMIYSTINNIIAEAVTTSKVRATLESFNAES